MDAGAVQERIAELGLDGWLLHDDRGRNEPALAALGLSKTQHLSRRFFYWIPRSGSPVKLVHAVEAHSLDSLSGTKRTYGSWRELQGHLQEMLGSAHRVAMEYSPGLELPSLSVVDAGCVDLVRSLGTEVVSSAALIAHALPQLTDSQSALHCEAALACAQTMRRSFLWIRDHLKAGQLIHEWDVVDFIEGDLASQGLVYDHAPTCSVNQHSASPHYAPRMGASSAISPGDWILIDLWGRKEEASAPYADITCVGVAAARPSKRQQELFQLVKAARDRAIAFIRERLRAGRPVLGWEVDRAARRVIEEGGYGPYFTHRLGHNITDSLHGPGTHLDDYETHDVRPLLPGCCFSIEPGIYIPGEFGIRLECDALLTKEGELSITGEPQGEITCLLGRDE